ILARLNAAIAACDTALGPARPAGERWSDAERTAGLRLNEYAEAARTFAWSELADWYVESVKTRLTSDGPDREVARSVLVHAFDQVLRLLHPIVPFVTEALWGRLPGRESDQLLASAAWPRPRPVEGDTTGFEVVREAVTALRQLRGDYGIPPGREVAAQVVPAAGTEELWRDEAELIGRLARCTVRVVDVVTGEAAAHAVLADGTQLAMPLAGVIDVAKECARLQKELETLDRQLDGLRARLANPGFLSRARPDVVEGERRRESEWSARRDLLARKVSALCGA
ncbi:MAG TPA: class I tRNA ligase family protein, partial [Gemmatimonadaceae bacterium]